MSQHQMNSPASAAIEEQKLLAVQYEADELAKTVRISRERIESAEDLSRRSAKMKDVRRYRLLHEDRSRLNAAARAAAEELGLAPVLRLAPSRHDVYAMIRTCVVKGYAGLRAAAKEICAKLDMKLRTFWHSMADLRRLKILGFTENFDACGPYSCIKTKRVYVNQRVENTWWIAHKAPQRDFRLALEAEGRRGGESRGGRTARSHSLRSSDKNTEVCTTPKCKNGTATPRLRRREGDLAVLPPLLSPFVGEGQGLLAQPAQPAAGDEGRANRADFPSKVRAILDRPSSGSASEAKNGAEQVPDQGRVNPREHFAAIGWEPAT